ncbi:MAG: hypothetical protein N2C14_32315, partial [Planctomycetales bacterium]
SDTGNCSAAMVEEKRKSPGQFSIGSLFLVIVYVACCLGWVRMLQSEHLDWWLAYYYCPGSGNFVVVVGLLIPAYFHLGVGSRSACSKVWNIIALAWFILLAIFIRGVIMSRIFRNFYPGIFPVPPEWVIEVHVELIRSASIPLFFTVPLIYLLIVRRKSTPQGVTRWLFPALGVATADLALISMGLWRICVLDQ